MYVIRMQELGYYKEGSTCYTPKTENARKFTTYAEADAIVQFWKDKNSVLGLSYKNARVIKLIPF